jgi:MFS family permease
MLPAFPPLVWVVLAGTLLTRTAFFMVWPFLAVLLERQFHLPPSQIGTILTIASAAGIPVGFWSGHLSDRFGRRGVLIAGCVGTVGAFLILATATTVYSYALGAFLVGLCRVAIETTCNALIADSIEEQRIRESAFNSRYFLINVGGAIGPLVGFLFGLSARQVTFWIACLVYGLYTLLLVTVYRGPELVRSRAREETTISNMVRTLGSDPRFLLLLLANFLAMVAYAQQESTLVQYLNLKGRDIVLGLFTALMLTNTLTVIAFQFPLLRLLRSFDLFVRAYAGLGLFAAGFVTYALLPIHSYLGWIAGTWILSIGEAILFPTLNLQVDRMAPSHLKGSYFGASALSGLGFSVGPLVGGYLLQYVGGPMTFVVTALLTTLGALSYWQSSRMTNATRTPETVA